MEDLKIRVTTEAESKEAQELFFELGYGWHGKGKLVSYLDETLSDGFGWLVLWKPPYLTNTVIQLGSGFEDCKEITLQELRDMVNQDQDEPFLTPETTLNDQYAEIEQVRKQAIKVESGSDSDHSLDAMSFGFMSISEDTSHVRKQTIEATLAERQAQYGCFEDVAFVTENIMAVLSKVRTNGLNDLPHTHRMALYMIASKMARIVNGDFNHKDGWHDIGGYSKLVEDLL